MKKNNIVYFGVCEKFRITKEVTLKVDEKTKYPTWNGRFLVYTDPIMAMANMFAFYLTIDQIPLYSNITVYKCILPTDNENFMKDLSDENGGCVVENIIPICELNREDIAAAIIANKDIYSTSELIPLRYIVASFGECSDILKDDPSYQVRAALAFASKELEYLSNDKHGLVRSIVASSGYNVDKLKNDSDMFVRKCAIENGAKYTLLEKIKWFIIDHFDVLGIYETICEIRRNK